MGPPRLARDYVSSASQNFSVRVSLAGIEPVGFRVKSDLRNHQAIVQPRLPDGYADHSSQKTERPAQAIRVGIRRQGAQVLQARGAGEMRLTAGQGIFSDFSGSVVFFHWNITALPKQRRRKIGVSTLIS